MRGDGYRGRKDACKKTVEKREIVNGLLTKEQIEAIEIYADALCELYGFLAKKAFFKGCEFTASFLLETGTSKQG